MTGSRTSIEFPHSQGDGVFLAPKVPFVSLWSLLPACSALGDDVTIDAKVALIFLTAWLIDDFLCVAAFKLAGLSTTLVRVEAGTIGAPITLVRSVPKPGTPQLTSSSVLNAGSVGVVTGPWFFPLTDGNCGVLTVSTGEKFHGLLLAPKLRAKNSKPFVLFTSLSMSFFSAVTALRRRRRQKVRSDTARVKATSPPAIIPSSCGVVKPAIGAAGWFSIGFVAPGVLVTSIEPVLGEDDGTFDGVSGPFVGAVLTMVTNRRKTK